MSGTVSQGAAAVGSYDFEKKFSSCDDQTAWANIAEICGIEQPRIFNSTPEAVYAYRDEDGGVLFEKLRYPGKRFSQRTIGVDGEESTAWMAFARFSITSPKSPPQTTLLYAKGKGRRQRKCSAS